MMVGSGVAPSHDTAPTTDKNPKPAARTAAQGAAASVTLFAEAVTL
jgi:hypothetical protein